VENATLSSTSSEAADIVARTAEFSLLRPAVGRPILTSVTNPNGLEKTADGRTFFWMGDKPTVFTVISTTNSCAQLSGEAIFGPSSSLRYRTIEASGASTPDPGCVILQGGKFHCPVRLQAGFNELSEVVKEPATSFLPADPRPLLLRVDNLNLEGTECDAKSR
jgi:hypothetical protein